MLTKLVAALALVALVGFRVEAQETDLQRIADALDVSTTKTFQFTGNGTMYSLGQSTSPAAAWPRQFVKSMTRVYDFTAGAMRDDIVRMAGQTQSVGPEQQVIQYVSGEHAWNLAGKNNVHRLWEATERQHQLWISPHGVMRAAFANNATATKRTIEGRPMSVISFVEKGKQKVIAYVNDQNAIERVESWYGHPITGDMKVVTHYGAYRDFAGVKFPSNIIQYQDGLITLDLRVTAVRANPTVNIEVPAEMRGDPTAAKSEKAADGVWYITGGSAHSVLIEMKDYLIVVEGPHGEQRAMAVMAEVKKLVPNKPIKYLVNTHHHFDHTSGVRAFAAEGVTIVTHEVNRPYYEKAMVNSHNFSPDRLARSGKKPVFQTMGDNSSPPRSRRNASRSGTPTSSSSTANGSSTCGSTWRSPRPPARPSKRACRWCCASRSRPASIAACCPPRKSSRWAAAGSSRTTRSPNATSSPTSRAAPT
jgi:hypothetical protein